MSVTGEVRQPRMVARRALSRSGLRGRSHGGMTLAELLVAMMVLLVGIYAVAKGFPSLFQQVQADSDRSAMARLTERVMNIAKAGPSDLPFAIYGYAVTGSGASAVYGPIRPDEEPRDPDEVDLTVNPPNSRDDIINVVGEPLTIPAVYTPVGGATANTVVRVPLQVGPARTDPSNGDAAQVAVYQLVPLVRTDDPPALTGNHTAPGTYYVDPTTGQFFFPQQAQLVANGPLVDLIDPIEGLVDYAWVNTDPAPAGQYKPQLYVQRERVAHTGTVLPAAPTAGLNFLSLVPEECRAWLRVPVYYGDADPATGTGGVGYDSGTPNGTPPVGTFYLEYNYGATLLFNPADSGRQVFVDYTLRTGTTGNTGDDSRRELMIAEDLQVPTVDQGPPYSVKLAIGGLEDVDPLFGDAVDGGDINDAGSPTPKSPVHLLIVDLTDGRTYAYTDADANHTPPSPAWWAIDNVDYVNGMVSLNATNAANCLGHRCRFYYRTLDQHALQVTKAPATFLQNTVAALYTNQADVAYRIYTPSTQDMTGGGKRTILTFPESSAGQTVSVDYTYGGDPGVVPPVLPLRATGEMHVIHEESGQIALDNPNVVSIIAVRGASVKARGWWRAQQGKLRHIDVDSCLLRLL
jgi:hypothetical protein